MWNSYFGDGIPNWFMHNKQSKNTNARLIAVSVASAFAWGFVLLGVGVGICLFWSTGLYEELFYSSSSVIIIFFDLYQI